MEFDFFIVLTFMLFVLKLCGTTITWTQVFIPLFLLCGVLICITIGAIAICFKLVNKYGLDESQKLVDELGNLIKG